MISSAYRNQLVGSVSLAKLPLKVVGLFFFQFPRGSFPAFLVLLADWSYTPGSVGICIPVAGYDKAQWFFAQYKWLYFPVGLEFNSHRRLSLSANEPFMASAFSVKCWFHGSWQVHLNIKITCASWLFSPFLFLWKTFLCLPVITVLLRDWGLNTRLPAPLPNPGLSLPSRARTFSDQLMFKWPWTD